MISGDAAPITAAHEPCTTTHDVILAILQRACYPVALCLHGISHIVGNKRKCRRLICNCFLPHSLRSKSHLPLVPCIAYLIPRLSRTHILLETTALTNPQLPSSGTISPYLHCTPSALQSATLASSLPARRLPKVTQQGSLVVSLGPIDCAPITAPGATSPYVTPDSRISCPH